MHVRVFNYNTLERVHSFEAHSDYIRFVYYFVWDQYCNIDFFLRCIAAHPSQSFILTSSDDMLIKLWDWDKKWQCQQVFEGHTHYVMQVCANSIYLEMIWPKKLNLGCIQPKRRKYILLRIVGSNVKSLAVGLEPTKFYSWGSRKGSELCRLLCWRWQAISHFRCRWSYGQNLGLSEQNMRSNTWRYG